KSAALRSVIGLPPLSRTTASTTTAVPPAAKVGWVWDEESGAGDCRASRTAPATPSTRPPARINERMTHLREITAADRPTLLLIGTNFTRIAEIRSDPMPCYARETMADQKSHDDQGAPVELIPSGDIGRRTMLQSLA